MGTSKRMLGVHAVALPVALLLGACDAAREAQSTIDVLEVGAPLPGAECTPGSAAGTAAGASSAAADRDRVLDRSGGYPCRLVAVRTAVRLTPSEDGSRPDPSWTSVALDRRGRIYSAARTQSGPGTVLAWNADGSFRATVGREGEGPGELSGRGLKRVYVGAGDSLIIRDVGRWSVFGPDLTFGRVINSAALQRAREHVHPLDDGRFLVTEPVPGAEPEHWFHVVSATGHEVRSFGPADPTAVADHGWDAANLPPRPSAYRGGFTFWAAPAATADGEYVLEERSVDGQLLRTLRRAAPWLHEEVAVSPRLTLPAFQLLHQDEAGLLWVLAIVQDPRNRDPGEEAPEGERDSALFDVRWEVIDPDVGEVLASGVIDTLPGEDEVGWPPVARFLQGRAVSYWPVPDSLGLETIEFLELKLVADGG